MALSFRLSTQTPFSVLLPRQNLKLVSSSPSHRHTTGLSGPGDEQTSLLLQPKQIMQVILFLCSWISAVFLMMMSDLIIILIFRLRWLSRIQLHSWPAWMNHVRNQMLSLLLLFCAMMLEKGHYGFSRVWPFCTAITAYRCVHRQHLAPLNSSNTPVTNQNTRFQYWYK